MKAILTEPAAATLLVLDEVGGATLTQIAQATGKPTSTIQRAVHSLIDANAIVHEAPRGRLRFTAEAPRHALRQLSEWRLGALTTNAIVEAVHDGLPNSLTSAPSTIRDARIRAAWPAAIRSIVSAYQPTRVILFGSQARGDATSQSDVDLLVVFAGAVDRRNRRVDILRLLSDMPFAKDVLVATTSDVAQPLIGSALADAVREGVTVYER